MLHGKAKKIKKLKTKNYKVNMSRERSPQPLPIIHIPYLWANNVVFRNI